jgi:hypothetical protein
MVPLAKPHEGPEAIRRSKRPGEFAIGPKSQMHGWSMTRSGKRRHLRVADSAA